jgi:hypothetical protein
MIYTARTNVQIDDIHILTGEMLFVQDVIITKVHEHTLWARHLTRNPNEASRKFIVSMQTLESFFDRRENLSVNLSNHDKNKITTTYVTRNSESLITEYLIKEDKEK